MDSILDILIAQAYQLLAIIPALLKAAVIFLVGYVIARILYQLLRRLVAASGLDRFTERLMTIDLFRNAKWDILPSRLIAATVYYFVLIIFVMAAVEALGMEMLSRMMADLVAYIPNAITAFLVLLIGIFLADRAKQIILTACRSLGIGSANLIASVIFYFILLNVILIALNQAQLQTQFMETNISILLGGLAGAFAIGYGLASRHVMGNIISSFYSRNQLRMGDEISIAGHRGEVIQLSNVDITLRSEDSDIIIPFSRLSSEGYEIHSRRDEGPPLPSPRPEK
jgi:hypothetical protein